MPINHIIKIQKGIEGFQKKLLVTQTGHHSDWGHLRKRIISEDSRHNVYFP